MEPVPELLLSHPETGQQTLGLRGLWSILDLQATEGRDELETILDGRGRA
jgi:hypothetical protein